MSAFAAMRHIERLELRIEKLERLVASLISKEIVEDWHGKAKGTE